MMSSSFRRANGGISTRQTRANHASISGAKHKRQKIKTWDATAIQANARASYCRHTGGLKPICKKVRACKYIEHAVSREGEAVIQAIFASLRRGVALMIAKTFLMFGLAFGLGCGETAFAAQPEAETAPTILHGPIPTPPAHRPTDLGKAVAAPEPAPVPFVPMVPAIAIQKADAYFNKTTTMIADFVQIGSDGRRAEGKIFVQKPGRLRFEYAAPATLDVIADGTTVVVVDRKVNSIQQYFIWQTPLKFLLKENIDLNRDVRVLNVTSEPDNVAILVEDKQVFGGTSRIKLMFDPATFMLKQWEVTDPQGYETLVSLFNQDFTKTPNPALFQIYRNNASSNAK